MERGGAIQPDRNHNPDPRSRGENGGLEYEKAESGREGGKRRTHCLKKRTYSPTETVIQNPDLGVRMGVWNMRKLLRDGGWKEAQRAQSGQKRTDSQTETRIQTPGLGARTGVWNMRYSGRDEGGKRRSQGLKKRPYSQMETVIQNPDLGVRRGVWNIRKLLRDGGWKKRALGGKKRSYTARRKPESRPPVSGREPGSGIWESRIGTIRWKAVHPLFKEADLQPNGDGNPEPRSRRENGGSGT